LKDLAADAPTFAANGQTLTLFLNGNLLQRFEILFDIYPFQCLHYRHLRLPRANAKISLIPASYFYFFPDFKDKFTAVFPKTVEKSSASVLLQKSVFEDSFPMCIFPVKILELLLK
jgi:hypothetical protein